MTFRGCSSSVISPQSEGSHVLIATKSIVRKLITTYHRESAVITRLSPTQTIFAIGIVAQRDFSGPPPPPPRNYSTFINGTARYFTVIGNERRVARSVTFFMRAAATRDSKSRSARVIFARPARDPRGIQVFGRR